MTGLTVWGLKKIPLGCCHMELRVRCGEWLVVWTCGGGVKTNIPRSAKLGMARKNKRIGCDDVKQRYTHISSELRKPSKYSETRHNIDKKMSWTYGVFGGVEAEFEHGLIISTRK